MAAVSVDPPHVSEGLRTQLSLSFPLLCDTERRVIRDWDILNVRERGGIAKPAVFVMEPGRMVRFAAVDHVVRRTPAVEIVSFLQKQRTTEQIHRRVHVPLVLHWFNAIRNNFRR